MRNRFDASKREAIIADYVAGLTLLEIAKKHGCCVTYPYKLASMSGLIGKRLPRPAANRADMAADLFDGKLRNAEIAEKYGVSRSTVANLAMKIGRRAKAGRPPKFDQEAILREYRGGDTGLAVARRHGCTAAYVWYLDRTDKEKRAGLT